LTATVATVITQYLQYNNTIIPNTTTIYNASATDSLYQSVSNVLISDFFFEYSKTVLDFETTTDFGTVVV